MIIFPDLLYLLGKIFVAVVGIRIVIAVVRIWNARARLATARKVKKFKYQKIEVSIEVLNVPFDIRDLFHYQELFINESKCFEGADVCDAICLLF